MEEKIDVKQYTFMDIDEAFEQAKRHLLTHQSNIWYRKSCSKDHYHVMIQNPCDICQCFIDTRFSGQILFNNKGNNIADLTWINLHNNSKKQFPSTIIVHFMFPAGKTFYHYYIDWKYFTEYLKKFGSELEILYYSFHSAVIKFDKYFEFHTESESAEITLEEYLEKYNMKPFTTATELEQQFVKFTQFGTKHRLW